MFTINSSLCEVEYSINLENRDVDVMEFIYFKIRENRNNPSDTLTIGFSEMKKGIGRYKKQSFIESLKRLNGVTITTNVKSENPSKKFRFNFIIEKNSFKVELDEKIFKLFYKPTSYNMYPQHYVYNFDEKYSKLFYKFIIRYRNLIGESIFVDSDVLMKILNIHSDKPFYKIQSDIFYSSVNKINEKTNLNISFEKESIEYKNDTEIVKYRVTINSYKKDDKEVKGEDLKRKRKEKKQKSESEMRLDKWINEYKEELKFNTTSSQIPLVGIEVDDGYPIYIDDEYRLTNCVDKPFTNSPQKTLEELNNILQNGGDVKVIYNVGFPKNLSKVCLLSESELKRRGMI